MDAGTAGALMQHSRGTKVGGPFLHECIKSAASWALIDMPCTQRVQCEETLLPGGTLLAREAKPPEARNYPRITVILDPETPSDELRGHSHSSRYRGYLAGRASRRGPTPPPHANRLTRATRTIMPLTVIDFGPGDRPAIFCAMPAETKSPASRMGTITGTASSKEPTSKPSTSPTSRTVPGRSTKSSRHPPAWA